MSVDFAALVHAVVAGVADVRACLMVSRDGLALGAFPAGEEERALAAWSKVTALGEIDRGFVGLREETWVFCRRGPYAALAMVSPSARAGLILDRLEEMLLVAEESRTKKEAFRSAPDRDASTLETPRGPRTPLHRESREETPTRPPTPVQDENAPPSVVAAEETAAPVPPDTQDRGDEAPDETPSPDEASWMVDTMALRREFAGILMPPAKQDEES